MVNLWKCDRCKREIYEEDNVCKMDIKELCLNCRQSFLKWVEEFAESEVSE